MVQAVGFGGDDGSDMFIVKPNAVVPIFQYTPATAGLKFSSAASAFPRAVQHLDSNLSTLRKQNCNYV